mmetsp:Transcript_45800/g.109274  ORF Transcript_45800/g.109274 Transcript_45800/m.109274 type:complete len:211 (-) Transcript_45800:147-779(-)
MYVSSTKGRIFAMSIRIFSVRVSICPILFLCSSITVSIFARPSVFAFTFLVRPSMSALRNASSRCAMRFCVSSPRSSTSTIFASCFSQLLSTFSWTFLNMSLFSSAWRSCSVCSDLICGSIPATRSSSAPVRTRTASVALRTSAILFSSRSSMEFTFVSSFLTVDTASLISSCAALSCEPRSATWPSSFWNRLKLRSLSSSMRLFTAWKF